MNLVFDIGNSRCKIAVYQKNNLVETSAIDWSEAMALQWIQKYPNARIAYASVRGVDNDIDHLFFNVGAQRAKAFKQFPISSAYATQSTLGDDRWAAVCAGALLAPENIPYMIIQLGTAFTFDYTSSKRVYLGGAISPGVRTRFIALHNFTAALPLLEPNRHFADLGHSTKDSIISGVMVGCLAEIMYRIDQFRSDGNQWPVYIGGGDLRYFDICGKNNIFAVPDIVLMGLNHLLNLNA